MYTYEYEALDIETGAAGVDATGAAGVEATFVTAAAMLEFP